MFKLIKNIEHKIAFRLSAAKHLNKIKHFVLQFYHCIILNNFSVNYKTKNHLDV